MAERNAAQKSSEQTETKQPQSPKQSQSAGVEAVERSTKQPGSLALAMPQLLLDPFSTFRSFYEGINRIMDPSGNRSSDRLNSLTAWVPPIEIEQYGNKYVVSAELPGIQEKDINVEVDDDMLVIRGERQESYEDDRGGMRRTERRYGQFYRTIPLPAAVDPNQGHARISNGVLMVSFPLIEPQSQRKQIPVTAGEESLRKVQHQENNRERSKAA